MFAMITTEEYQELVLAQEEKKRLVEELERTDRMLMQKEYDFKELLLFITQGKHKTEFDDGKFRNYNIVSGYDLVDFINDNYVEDGILKFNKVKKENTNE